MSNQFIGQNLADKYQIEEELRDGGLGKVYRAKHLLMEKPVAVKILPPSLAVDENIVKRFSAEARTVSHISHPNILNVTDFGSDKNGAVYIVMEDAEGETLKEAIEREGKFTVERAVKIVRQIASALSTAHVNGVIHHHLNSENILLAHKVDEPEMVKVLDFGSGDFDKENLFNEDSDLDKLKYLSPEQNSSFSKPDERSDIYSLGVIFYEMLAGEVPFTAETATDLIIKQSENPPPPLSAFRSDLPEYIEPMVIKALAKNPEMRYQSVNEFNVDLNRAARNFGEPETLVAPNENEYHLTGNLWKTAFVVLLGVVGLSAAMIYFTQGKQTNPTTQLQTDVNGQPVQPLNPATGINEQGASSLMPYSPEMMANSNTAGGMPMPQTLPGGDGYDAWARGGQPPAGAPPMYLPPSGQVITIPGESGSQFMPPDGSAGYYLVPANTNANVSVKPSPTPKGKATPAAAETQPSPTPAANPQPTPETKATPVPKTEKPPAQPAEKPKAKPPATTEKQTQSGKQQDS